MKSPISISLIIISTITSAWAEMLPQDVIRNTSNEIDQFVAHALQKKKLTANPIIDDATFARRCYINISGRIPTADEARSFIQEKDPNKRGLLIDYLITSDGHKSQMFNFWADLLRLQTKKERGGLGWHVWIRDAVDANMPYDQFVNSMLSASGNITDNPAVGYYLRDREMLLDNVSNTVQIFLGNRIGCAQCHDHPTEDLTQKQYYEMAAFSSANTFRNNSANLLMKKAALSELGVDAHKDLSVKNFRQIEDKLSTEKKAALKELGREYGYILRNTGLDKTAVPEDPSKNLKIPHDYQYNDAKPGDIVKPKVFFGPKISRTKPAEQKQAFADWVTTKENPYFTKVIVNRLWAEVFGKGIVEPLDDWSETTRVPNPELLDYLSQIMIATEYDLREFMRVLYNTRLFASAVAIEEDNLGDSCDFKGPVLRRLKAEELHDSLLTLEHGSQDSTGSQNLKNEWNNYIARTNDFLNSSFEDLKSKKDRFSGQRELRINLVNLRSSLKKATQEGDESAAATYKKQLAQAQQETNARRRAGKAIEKSQDEAAMSMTSSEMNSPKNKYSSSKSLRASEKPTPHKPASFLSQFGASDRNTSDAAHTEANIPQALTLLNGQELKSLTTSRSALMQATLRDSLPEKRLDTLFLGIYGQFPTETERTKFQPLVSNPDELRKLAHAMMTSKRFLFVQ